MLSFAMTTTITPKFFIIVNFAGSCPVLQHRWNLLAGWKSDQVCACWDDATCPVQVAFISLVINSVIPLRCFDHPTSGRSSRLKVRVLTVTYMAMVITGGSSVSSMPSILCFAEEGRAVQGSGGLEALVRLDRRPYAAAACRPPFLPASALSIFGGEPSTRISCTCNAQFPARGQGLECGF